MTKELTPLEALQDIKQCLFWSEKGLKEISIIETALKEYEELNGILPDFIHSEDDLKNLCSRELKELKALEIIKEALKSENKIGLQDEHFDYVDFDENYLCIDGTISLTKEEYDLLKEVLK